MTIRLGRLGTYDASDFNSNAALASTYEAESQRLFVVNAEEDAVDVLSLSDPRDPFLLFSIDVSSFGSAPAAIAVSPTEDIIAVAITGTTPQAPGTVALFDATGTLLSSRPVGATPRSLAFTPDGQRLLVANAGEPNSSYTVDPGGSISIIDLSNGPAAATVQARGFGTFQPQRAALIADGVRLFGPNASVAQDLEPEAIAIAEDGLTAYIALQENNAVAVLDLMTNVITEIRPLGTQDYRLPGNALDPSDDGEINIAPAPVQGLYQPGAIATYTVAGESFFVFANEGASRDTDGFSEVEMVSDLTLDPVAFPPAPTPTPPTPPVAPMPPAPEPPAPEPPTPTPPVAPAPPILPTARRVTGLQEVPPEPTPPTPPPAPTPPITPPTTPPTAPMEPPAPTPPAPPTPPAVPPTPPLPQFTAEQVNAILGDLAVSNVGADSDGDGDVDQLLTFGTRSFSIRDAAGNLVYDSGDDFEQITADQLPALFNASSLANTADAQSNDRGPQPSAVTVGQVDDRTYAFTTLRSIGGVMVYDITDPNDVSFVQYVNDRESGPGVAPSDAGSLGPSDITFVSAADSSTGIPLLAITNAVSGTTSVHGVFNPIDDTTEIQINEIRTDQPGANTDHYFELSGTPGSTLDGVAYLVLGDGLVDTDGDGIAETNGGSGVVEAVVDLSGNGFDQDGLFVVAESTFSLGEADLIAPLNFENNDNVTHLLVHGLTSDAIAGLLNTDLDTDDDGVLDSVPWTRLFDSVALVQSPTLGEQVYSDTTVGPDVFLAPNHVFRTPAPPAPAPDSPPDTPPMPPTVTPSVETPEAPEGEMPGGEMPGGEVPEPPAMPPAVPPVMVPEPPSTPGDMPDAPSEEPPGEDIPQPGEFQIGPISPAIGVGMDTPGRPNVPLMLTPIYEIQGAGHTSALTGQMVATTGIVTALGDDGFYLQSATGDGDIATSDAIFVFLDRLPNLRVGDRVNVQGTVEEFVPGGAGSGNLSTTQLVSPIISRLSGGNALPEAVLLGPDGRSLPTEVIDDDQETPYNLLTEDLEAYEPETDGIDFYESLEGMRVTIPDPVVVGPTNRFGEIYTYAGGSSPTGLSDRGTLNIGPDDFNPERIQIDPDSAISPAAAIALDVGDTLSDVTGVVGYAFGNYEVIPTETFTVTEGTLEPETSTLAPTANQLTVASYNVLNLDPVVEAQTSVVGQNINNIDDDQGDGRFAAIAADIVNNLNTPDIIGLQEIQDNDGAQLSAVSAADVTFQTLIDAIIAAGGPTYQFIDTPGLVPASATEDGTLTNPVGGQPGGNIRVGFLYNPERVSLVENSVVPLTTPADQASNPENPFFGSRIPLAATFEFNQQEVTVVNNHFSSRGGSAPLFGQVQPAADLQDNLEAGVSGGLAARLAQAEAVQTFVSGILTEDADANVIALGDFNAFEFSPPLEALEADLNNLTNTLPENERYSFIFEGNSQALDHILVSDSLNAGAEFDIVHVNSEFAAADDRASDHDPLLARLTLAPPVGVPVPPNPDLPPIAPPEAPTEIPEMPEMPLGISPEPPPTDPMTPPVPVVIAEAGLGTESPLV